MSHADDKGRTLLRIFGTICNAVLLELFNISSQICILVLKLDTTDSQSLYEKTLASISRILTMNTFIK